MLKIPNMALYGCPVGFSEEIFAVFEMKKSPLEPKMTKIPKFSNFQRFHAFFTSFLTDFVDWNAQKGQQKQMRCPLGFFQEFNAVSL